MAVKIADFGQCDMNVLPRLNMIFLRRSTCRLLNLLSRTRERTVDMEVDQSVVSEVD